MKPPVAKQIPRVESLHGDRREDPYFWLREKENPEVIAYLTAENEYADAMTNSTVAFQEALYQEMLARIKEDDRSVPYRKGRHFYYSRTEKGKQYPIYCRTDDRSEAPEQRSEAPERRSEAPERSAGAREQITLELNRLAEGHSFLSIGVYAVSDDGRWLAYTADVTGFRDYTLYVKDLETGELATDRLEKVSTVAWCADSATFFYVVEDHAKRPYRLYRHRLGEIGDELIYEEKDELFRLRVSRSRSLAYVFASSGSFTSTEVRFAPAADPMASWRLIHAREKDHEYEVDHGGELFYIRTNGDGLRNFRLVTAPVHDPARARWTELIPHRDDVMLEDFDVFAGHYVVHERADGLTRLYVTSLGSRESHHVEFPEPAYDVSSEPNLEFVTTRYRFRYQSMVTPSSVFDYDMDGRQLILLKRTEVLGGYDPARYRTTRLHATAPDGTRIPISLVSQKDAPLDGSRPLLLAGYGAYGIPYPVMFSSTRLSLLDRGVSFAIAHIRGGGELGKRWHDDGRMLKKKNTFTDFIAVAEFLIGEGYTARDRLVIEGGSAGGLLMGAVLNERPELFHAAVLRVPFVDVTNTMLDESLPLTVGEFEEWGNPKIREHYEYMKTYCPYTNLTPRPYPSMLVRTSLNDSQVMYWEPAKYVARLRTLGVDHALIFKIEMGAGHGGPSGRYDALRDTTFDYAFVLKAVSRAE